MTSSRFLLLGRRHFFSAVAGSVITVIGLLGPMTRAFAHAGLADAVPAPAATLPSAPSAVVLTFTEAMEPKFSTIEVRNAQGERVDKADSHTAPGNRKQLIVDLKPLPPGVYKVLWQVTSVDTHRSAGTYPFTIKP